MINDSIELFQQWQHPNMFSVENIFNMTCCNNIMLPLCRELNANCSQALLLYADDKMKVSEKKRKPNRGTLMWSHVGMISWRGRGGGRVGNRTHMQYIHTHTRTHSVDSWVKPTSNVAKGVEQGIHYRPHYFLAPASLPSEDRRDIFFFYIKVNNVACRHNFPGNTIKCAVNLWWSSISSYQGNITHICRPSL